MAEYSRTSPPRDTVLPESDPIRPQRQHGPRELALTLAWLRVCAIVGQVLTVLLVAHVLALPIPEAALFAGIASLALFAVAALWRLHRPWPVGEAEVVAHFGVDIGVLGYLLYCTGGATNPFISLYIMPIALAATALSARYLALVVLLAGGAYLLLTLWHVPLPSLHEQSPHSEFSLHVLGMSINFAISALLLGFFIWRLARELRARAAEVQRERERALRDEGILAIATQAAGAAHELNTPLSTMRTLLTELRRDHAANAALREDLELLAGQADRCRDILRELVAWGTEQLDDATQALGVPEFVADCADRFRLLRPVVELETAVADDCRTLSLRIAPGLRHALINLLNNAAEASQAGENPHVELSVARDATSIEFRVRDFGPGLAPAAGSAAGLRFFSDKRDGLGIGLALANATAERLSGDLQVEPAAGGGTRTRLRLPLAAIENRGHDRS